MTACNDRYKQHNDCLDDFMTVAPVRAKNSKFYRRDNRPIFGSDGRRQKKIRTGEGDAWGVINGIHCEFEVKTGNAKLSTSQKIWKKEIEGCGGLYFIVRPENFEVVMSIIEILQKEGFNVYNMYKDKLN